MVTTTQSIEILARRIGVKSHELGITSDRAVIQAAYAARSGFFVFPGSPGGDMSDATCDVDRVFDLHWDRPHESWSVAGGPESGLVILRFKRPRDLEMLQHDICQLPLTPTITRGMNGPEYRLFRPTFCADIDFSCAPLHGTHGQVASAAPLPGSPEPISGMRWHWKIGATPAQVNYAPLPQTWVDALPRLAAGARW